MAYENEQLVAEKPIHNGEDKVSLLEEKKLWIPFGKISWAAIFAGVLVITVTQMLFSLLGMGIGISTINPLQEQQPVRGLGMATMIWWSVTMLVSLFLGGLTTGKMYQTRSKSYLSWHGFLTWSTFTVLSFFLLTTSIGMLVSGASNMVGTAITASASLSQTNTPDISNILRSAQGLSYSRNDLYKNDLPLNRDDRSIPLEQNNGKRSMNTALQTEGTSQISPREADVSNQSSMNENVQQPQTNRYRDNPYLINEVRAFFSPNQPQSAQTRETLVNVLVNQTGMSRSEANDQVDKWMDSYEELKVNAKVESDRAARIISTASIGGFFALLLGAFVTILGARVAPMREYALAKKTEKVVVK